MLQFGSKKAKIEQKSQKWEVWGFGCRMETEPGCRSANCRAIWGEKRGFCGPTGVSMGDREREGKGGRRFGVKKGEFGAANKGGADGGGGSAANKASILGLKGSALGLPGAQSSHSGPEKLHFGAENQRLGEEMPHFGAELRADGEGVRKASREKENRQHKAQRGGQKASESRIWGKKGHFGDKWVRFGGTLQRRAAGWEPPS